MTNKKKKKNDNGIKVPEITAELEHNPAKFLHHALIEFPIKQLSDVLSNLEFVAGDRENIVKLVENLDPFIKRKKRRTIYYLRVYSNLLYAESFFIRGNLDRTRQFLEISRSSELGVKIREEIQYLKKIRSLITYVLNGIEKAKIANLEKDRLMTRIHIAQNLCVLRILEA